MSLPAYAELHCLSDFSFGRGASRAGELFERAKALGYSALAITDECSLAGAVRGLEAARDHDLKLIIGSEFQLADGPKLVLLVENRAGYTQLCRLITTARRRSAKGEYRLLRSDLGTNDLGGLLALWVPEAVPDAEHGRWLRAQFPQRLWLAVELHRGANDDARLQHLQAMADTLQLPLVACGDVHMHIRRRRALQDTLTAIRLGLPLAQAGQRLFPNGERHLRSRQALAAIYPLALLEETQRIAERCTFRLEELAYRYPHELVPEGHTPTTWLRCLTEQGAQQRWRAGTPPAVQELIDKELALIAELRYEAFFLTVHDVVRFAKSQGILCQGRGSAANSVVCFALGITEVDPARMSVLFERFLSRERNEPPDIDVDFEHERREEVIQYIYRRYGRERAALAATVIRYRARSALRDVARALGFSSDQIEQLTRCASSWSGKPPAPERLQERGFDPSNAKVQRLLMLVSELCGMPRHLSQHVGGFVVSEDPLHHLVPVENAAMPERTIIQWDKDDLETLGLLKVDCLALGMLTCIRKTLDLLRAQRGRDLTPATVPAEDPATYAMIQRGEVVGVFQIESRAQMAMLPRLKPACFYDLVIEVAIVRPGPIQGGMVHPYLRRRQGQEPVTYPSPALKQVLGRTLGIPLFQEQVMQIAMVAAGYTPGEADRLRRDMAAWKRRGGLEPHREKILAGMAERGYTAEFAERIFEQIKGFGDYGFPESHAASFALLSYVSAWLKCHEPAAFACALLNSLPMGFYGPAQIIYDLRRQGLAVRPPDVRYSHWDCTLEPWPDAPERQPVLRLGLRLLQGISMPVAERVVAARARQVFRDVDDLAERAALPRPMLDRLAEGGALRGLAGHRHRARWASAGAEATLPLFAGLAVAEERPVLSVPSAAEDLQADYASLGLTLGPHPLRLLRQQLQARRCRPSRALRDLPHGRHVRAAGLVTSRQRPATASGVTFVTLEDEDGLFNVVVWKALAERQRLELLEARLLAVDGTLETVDGVRHLIAGRLHDFTPLLAGLDVDARDFR